MFLIWKNFLWPNKHCLFDFWYWKSNMDLTWTQQTLYYWWFIYRNFRLILYPRTLSCCITVLYFSFFGICYNRIWHSSLVFWQCYFLKSWCPETLVFYFWYRLLASFSKIRLTRKWWRWQRSDIVIEEKLRSFKHLHNWEEQYNKSWK